MRAPFRHHSGVFPAARTVMAGFDVHGYALAIAGLRSLVAKG
jgi:3-dehydroquinate dehydratase